MLNVQNNNEARAKIFYFNDLHANAKGAKKIKSASDNFDAVVKNQKLDTFKFCAGDSYIGRNKSNFMGAFLNSLNLDGMTLGNHELDAGTKQISKFLNSFKFKVFTANLDYKKDNNLTDDLDAKRLVKSDIIEKNGNKYGIIGATAADIPDTTSKDTQEDCKDIGFMNFDQSAQAIQQEVNKLKSQGINKIILLSHLGIDKDRKLAQITDGIDVIVGGHSHHSFDGVKSGENYYASKSGEPVLILQAGQNGEKYGVLDVVFDKAGKIKAADNKLSLTDKQHESLIVKHIENISLPKLENLGSLSTNLDRMKSGFEEHPLACFVAEAIRKKSGAQIAFHNKGCQKVSLKAGNITNRDVQTALPYVNSVNMYKFSEKDVIDALKASIDVKKGQTDKLGNMQVAGMKYTIDEDNKLKDVYVLDGDKEIKLDVENPSTDKFYTVTYGSFYAGGPGRLKMLYAPEKCIQKFEWDDLQATIELLKEKNNNGVIDIQKDGRIKIERD